MNFVCKQETNEGLEKWQGQISNIINHGSHYEIRIESRSGLTVIFGKTSIGNFACVPDFDAGCHLATLDDEFYNKERLSAALNPVDGLTIAKALKVVSKRIGGEY